MATPFVAGAVARILQENPEFNRTQVVEKLFANAKPYDSGINFDAPRMLQTPTVDDATLAVNAATQAAAAEAARIAAEQAATLARASAKKKGAEKSAAAAKQLSASVSLAKRSLAVKALSNSRISVKVQAPKGSKTIVQVRTGNTWKNQTVRNTTASSTINVSRAGTYRVQIKISNKLVTSKSFSVAASVSLAKRSLAAKALSNSRISVKVQAPKGAKTIIQLKVGKTWKNVIVRNTTASTVVKVSRPGTYRVQIRISNALVTSKPIQVK
jgi:hypothetical protein